MLNYVTIPYTILYCDDTLEDNKTRLQPWQGTN